MKQSKTKRRLKKIDLHKFVPRVAGEGTPPGTVEYIGKPREEMVTINVIDYDETNVKEMSVSTVDELKPFIESPNVTWILVTGVHDTGILNQIGNLFKINSLELEAIANTTERPTMEEREDYIFVVLKAMQLDAETSEVTIEQVSMVLGKNYVITFHETKPMLFESLRNRIIASKGRIRRFTADYLLFALSDILIDQYFTLLEDIGETIETTEEQLILSPGQANQELIYKLKRRLVYVKKTIWPTREVMSSLQRSDHVLIHEGTKMYFRNIYDHTVQIIETLESLRDLTSGMMDLYVSAVSNRMNEIMKVLTIFSAIFIPITFLAGVYGMNFKIIPELRWDYGYYAFWGVTVIITVIMLFYFKRKKWF